MIYATQTLRCWAAGKGEGRWEGASQKHILELGFG